MRRRAMENDETYYLWSLQFFMEFSRVHDFRADLVGWAPNRTHALYLKYIISLWINFHKSLLAVCVCVCLRMCLCVCVERPSSCLLSIMSSLCVLTIMRVWLWRKDPPSMPDSGRKGQRESDVDICQQLPLNLQILSDSVKLLKN